MLDLATRLAQRLGGLGHALSGYFTKSPTRARVGELVLAIERHQSLRTASAMAFDLFLGIVPMIGLAGYAAAHLLHSQPLALLEGSRLLDLAPARLHEFLGRNLTAFAETEVAPLFALSALWLCSSAFVTMIRVFEESFDCNPRSWLVTRALAIGFAAAGLSLFLAAAAAGALMTWQGFSDDRAAYFARVLGISPTLAERFEPLGALAFFASSFGIAIYLALIYRFSIVRKVERKSIPGAVVATIIGLLGSALFAYYVATLGRYTAFYGSLAAIVIVLLWLWLWCTAILIGAEINVALEDTSARKKSSLGVAPDQGDDAGPTHTPSAAGNPEGDWHS